MRTCSAACDAQDFRVAGSADMIAPSAARHSAMVAQTAVLIRHDSLRFVALILADHDWPFQHRALSRLELPPDGAGKP